jgi:hypothetical protein
VRDPRGGRSGRADQPRPLPLAKRNPSHRPTRRAAPGGSVQPLRSRWVASPGLHHQLDRTRHHLSRGPPPRPCPRRGPHPLCQRHRAAQPAFSRLRQQRLLGRVDRLSPRPHRLHPGPAARR